MPITVITIEETRFNPATSKVLRSFQEVPEVYEPQLGRSKPVRSNHLTGVRANVPKNHFLASLFTLNEINACKGSPVQRDSLRRKMMQEYPNHKKSILNYFSDFSQKRIAFNQGLLYSNQPRPPLYAWLYNDAGYIYHPTAKTLMGFEDCVLELKAKKAIDPRFCKSYQIAYLRNKRLEGDTKALQLFIPTQEDIDKIVKHLFPKHTPKMKTSEQGISWDSACPLYNSITFPEGYGPEYK